MTYRQLTLATGLVAGVGFLTVISAHADGFPPPPPDNAGERSSGTAVSAWVNEVQSKAQQFDQAAAEAQQTIGQTCQ
jgi:hypothetical protein